jgi:micrococcal nuclease
MVRIRNTKKYSLLSALIGVLILSISSLINKPQLKNAAIMAPTPIPTIQSTQTLPDNKVVKVIKIIDGDTIEIETGQKVRYIGMDTPELHHPTKGVQCYGKEASIKNSELVEGKLVRLQKDVSETDRYGRLLRYVFLYDKNATESGSGLFVNKYLVEEGFAVAATFPPDVAFADTFRESQQEAMKNNKGLWKDCR